MKLVKEYQRPVSEMLKVVYEGELDWPTEAGGYPTIKGTWFNELEATFGVFGCVLEK